MLFIENLIFNASSLWMSWGAALRMARGRGGGAVSYISYLRCCCRFSCPSHGSLTGCIAAIQPVREPQYYCHYSPGNSLKSLVKLAYRGRAAKCQQGHILPTKATSGQHMAHAYKAGRFHLAELYTSLAELAKKKRMFSNNTQQKNSIVPSVCASWRIAHARKKQR